MYIEELENHIVQRLEEVELDGVKAFKSVKRYAGALQCGAVDTLWLNQRDTERAALLAAASEMPVALVYTSAVKDSKLLDLPCEEVDISILLLLKPVPEANRLHDLRLCVKQAMDGYDAGGGLLLPLASVRTDILAAGQDISVYEMQFKCEIEVKL